MTQAVLAYVGTCFVGSAQFTPDGVGAQAKLAFMGTCFVGSAQFTPNGVVVQAKLAYVGTFVGSAHTRQKLSFWTSSFLKKKVRKIYERYRSACCGRGLGRE